MPEHELEYACKHKFTRILQPSAFEPSGRDGTKYVDRIAKMDCLDCRRKSNAKVASGKAKAAEAKTKADAKAKEKADAKDEKDEKSKNGK